MSDTALAIDLNEWENRSDGLIFFDSSGNFRACSPKVMRLSGSEQVLREALGAASWPRDFALGRENISIAESILQFPAGAPVLAEFRCVRGREGFVAVLLLRPRGDPASRMEEPGTDSVFEIFSALMLERRAISRHLHGALTQDLVALSLSLSGVGNLQSTALSSAMAHVDRCCRGVRALSYVLAPPSFLNAGLIETIVWYGDVLRADAGIDFLLDLQPLPADPPAPIKELLFAGLQQMAAAAIWRPENARIRVRIRHEDRSILMRVDCACRPDEPVYESPLIRERAKTLGGRTRFTRGENEFSLEISLPWLAASATPQEAAR